MYYSSGNYEAFAHPKKPEGVDHKSAYIIGSGLAALTAACYLVRDGQMKGEHVHVFEKNALAGGACDGYKYDIGYVMRGGREMDNHFEVMWDLLHDIPSLEHEGQSVLDEHYWLNKEQWGYLWNHFQMTGLPMYLIIDKKGNIAKQFTHVTAKELKELLELEVNR